MGETFFVVFIALGGAVYAVVSILLWVGALRRNSPARQGELPTVSVIVPARNEAANIGACLHTLAAQDYPCEKWDVWVVDDRSDDGTGQIVAEMMLHLPICVHLLRIDRVPEGWSPKKHAITTAIAHSTGEIILTTDADCRPEPGWVRTMVHTLGDADLVAGYSPYDRRETLAGRLLALDTLGHAFVAMSGIGIGWPITCAGRSFGYRRKVFEALGFGRAHSMLSGDDHLFLQRAVGHGFRAVYCDAPGAKVWTDPPMTWSAFVHQRIRMFSGMGKLTLSVAAVGASIYTWLLAMTAGLVWLHPVAWAAFAAKFILDGVSLSLAARRLGEWALLRVYPLAAVLYLPYYLVFAFLGTFGTYRWKGQRGR